MPKMGRKLSGGTLIEGGDEKIQYPSIRLMDAEVKAVPSDAKIGDERMVSGKVRVSEMGDGSDGGRSATLEVLELYLEEKDHPTAADKMYPTMMVKD
jgi:hypothetical protein